MRPSEDEVSLTELETGWEAWLTSCWGKWLEHEAGRRSFLCDTDLGERSQGGFCGWGNPCTQYLHEALHYIVFT